MQTRRTFFKTLFTGAAAVVVAPSIIAELARAEKPKYRVMFSRVLTPRFTKDIDELRSYNMDIRQVLADEIAKNMVAEMDEQFMRAVAWQARGYELTCMAGAPCS